MLLARDTRISPHTEQSKVCYFLCFIGSVIDFEFDHLIEKPVDLGNGYVDNKVGSWQFVFPAILLMNLKIYS